MHDETPSDHPVDRPRTLQRPRRFRPPGGFLASWFRAGEGKPSAGLRWGLALALLVFLSLFITRPRLLGAYYYYQGGESLDQVTQALAEGRQAEASIWKVPSGGLSNRQRVLVARSVENLQKAVQFNPWHSKSYLLLGRALALDGRLDEALAAYDKFSQLRPKNPMGHLEAGFVYDLRGDLPAAVEEWGAAGVSSADLVAAGEQAERDGQLHQAIRWYQRAVEMDPGWDIPAFRLGLAYRKSNALPQALQAFKTTTEISPDLRDGWYELGKIYLELSDNDGALQAFENGLQASYGEVGASNVYFQLGRTYQTHPDSPGQRAALRAYQQAISLADFRVEPWQMAHAHFHRGEILASMFQWDQAIDEFNQALAINPQLYRAYISLAQVYSRLGKIDRAMGQLQIAIAVQPGRTGAYLALGDLYLAQGASDQARSMYRKVLELDPSDTLAQTKLSTLEEGTNAPRNDQ